MRAHDKKKIWRRNVAAIQKSGLVNLGSGQWGRGASNNSMTRDMVNGSSHRKVG
jgi:hypothetical protein